MVPISLKQQNMFGTAMRLVGPALRLIKTTASKIGSSRAGKWLATSLSVGSWGYFFYDIVSTSSGTDINSDPFAIIPTAAKRALLLDYCPKTLINPFIEEGLSIYAQNKDGAVVLFCAAQYLEQYPRVTDYAQDNFTLAEDLEDVMDKIVELDLSKEFLDSIDNASAISEQEVADMDLATRRLTDFFCFTLKTIQNV